MTHHICTDARLPPQPCPGCAQDRITGSNTIGASGELLKQLDTLSELRKFIIKTGSRHGSGALGLIGLRRRSKSERADQATLPA